MEINVNQEKFEWNYKYNVLVNGKENYYVEANRTILPLPRKVNIKNKDNEILASLYEKRIFLKTLLRIPILKYLFLLIIKKREKYEIVINNENIGEIQAYKSFKKQIIKILYKENKYIIYKKSNFKLIKFHMFKNKRQVGLIDKNYITYWNADKYQGLFDFNTDVLLNIICIIFIDLSFYTFDNKTDINRTSINYEDININKDIDVSNEFNPKIKG